MRIIVADHHPQTLRALRISLLEESDMKVVGTVADARSLVDLTQAAAADLVLLDADLPGASMEELIADLHAISPRPIVVVMSAHGEYGRRPLRAGADAFVSKSDDPNWLLVTLRRFVPIPRGRRSS